MKKNLFITGNPGVGKTTLIKEVCFSRKLGVGGFFTEELRKEGERYAFLLRTFNGEEVIFARKGLKSKFKVGKYGVDIEALEKVGVKAMEEARLKDEVIVVDEIGKMEIFSDKFREILVECLNSPKKVLATIRSRSQPFADEVKKIADSEILYLTKENYEKVKSKVNEWLNQSLS